ncbi:hypothetical protein LMG24076_05445 [Trinickia soli]|nr:hypothetical protein LMG24076_05445 [Trinickia soli]
MQIVTLELNALLAIEQHPVNMPRAVSEPIDRMTIGADRLDAVAQFVVPVMPYVALSLIE